MLGSGGALAMIQSLRNNKKLLRKKSLFKRDAVFLGTNKENYKATQGKVKERKVTPEQLREIREKTIAGNKQSNRRNLLIAFIIILPLLYYVIQNTITLMVQKEEALTADGKIITQKEIENFHFYVEDAHKWVQERHWHNAIFQYKKALVIFPKDFKVRQLLALAYTNHCRLKNKDCTEGRAYIDQLILCYPNHLTLQNIKSKFPSK